jgi:Uma2 family endonuclease
MRTVVLGDNHPELTEWIARRRAMRQDLHDEVWNGEYHMAPAAHGYHGLLVIELALVLHRLAVPRGLVVGNAFNLGDDVDNFRVPDLGVHRQLQDLVWVPTAAMVVEVVSPDDESWLKFDHYAAHRVDEVLIADPHERTLDLFVLTGGGYERADRSTLLDVSVADLHDAVTWPGSQ